MNLSPLLCPESVAIIGASPREGTLGNDTVRMIQKGGYTGGIYPVNPKYEEICGIKCYPSLEGIGHPVDCVVLCINATRVEQQIDVAVAAGAKSLVIFANCVVEGDTQPKLEERVLAKCRAAGIPLLGHNAMGFYNNDIGLRVCGFDAPDEGVKGNVAFISQSGSVFSTIGHNEPQLKFNLMVATGTGQVTALEDYMLYALEQPTTKVLGVYMESVRKPERFVAALETAAKKRVPVVLMKVGKSALGAKFAQSHTGGLAGDDDAMQAVLEHYGVTRAASICELANTLLLFSRYPEIPAGGLAAIADSGGERNLLADVAEEVGLSFAALSDETMERLAALQEYGQEAANPLDPWGTGIDFERIFEDSLVTMLADAGVAIGMISQDLRDGYYLSQGCVDALRGAARRQRKPVVFMTNFGGSRRADMTRQVNDFGACVLLESREALAAVRHWLDFRDFAFEESDRTARGEETDLPREAEALLRPGAALLERDSLAVLGHFGVKGLPAFPVQSASELAAAADKLVYPVVLKTEMPGILHKADVGGVRLGLADSDALLAAYADMAARLGPRAMAMPMFKADVELIFGMKRDDTFGPLVIVGAGGVYTELLRDRVVLLPTATKAEIARKLRTLKTWPLLTGFRGLAPVDPDALVEAIGRFCRAALVLGERVKEIDVNPVALRGREIVALDALIVTDR